MKHETRDAQWERRLVFTTTRVCCGICACASGRPRRVRMDPTEVRLRKVVASSLNKRLGFTQVKPAIYVPGITNKPQLDHALHYNRNYPTHSTNFFATHFNSFTSLAIAPNPVPCQTGRAIR